jgi:hypothetical protein
MALPNIFQQHGENTRTCWGYTFELTGHHLTPEQANPLKFSYDKLGEDALKALDNISPPSKGALPRRSDLRLEKQADEQSTHKTENATPKRDLYTLLRDHAETNDALGKLWLEVNTVPEWVDWEQIARGQDVFYRYAGPVLTALAFQSLLGGMVVGLNCGLRIRALTKHRGPTVS